MKDDLTRLPVWAQKRIADLEREREVAVRALNEHLDGDTVSPFYIDDGVCTGEQRGPSVKRRYIQGHTMTVEWKGVELSIWLRPDEQGIDLQWTSAVRHIGDVAMVPNGFNSVRIIAKDKLR